MWTAPEWPVETSRPRPPRPDRPPLELGAPVLHRGALAGRRADGFPPPELSPLPAGPSYLHGAAPVAQCHGTLRGCLERYVPKAKTKGAPCLRLGTRECAQRSCVKITTCRTGRRPLLGPRRRRWAASLPYEAYCAASPRSMASSAPLTNLASSDARYTAPQAMSSARPMAPAGWSAASQLRVAVGSSV